MPKTPYQYDQWLQRYSSVSEFTEQVNTVWSDRLPWRDHLNTALSCNKGGMCGNGDTMAIMLDRRFTDIS